MLTTADYAVDGLVPKEVRFPATVAALAEELARAGSVGLGVVPWGGGTQMGLGDPPRRFDLVLGTARLNRLVEHSPADLIATAEAGMTLAAIREALAPYEQEVAIDALLPQRATLGGILATGGSGPRCLGYGPCRDQVIGIKVAHPDGKITKSGGKVVKNVAGYDMAKLYIGSLGTLGVIVEATFRLVPLPAVTKTVRISNLRLEQIDALAHQAREVRLQPLAMTALNSEARQRLHGAARVAADEGAWLVALEFGGGAAVVERQICDGLAICGEHGVTAAVLEREASDGLWSAIRDFGRGKSEPSLIVKATVLPSQLPKLLAVADGPVEKAGVVPSLITHRGNGILYAFWSSEDLQQAEPAVWSAAVQVVRQASNQLGGSTVVEECPPQLKSVIDAWGPPPPSIAIMRRLKQQFDPQGILNPGRYVGNL